MFNNSRSERYRLSVFERLTDSKQFKNRFCDLETFKSLIKKELEDLLNTRSVLPWKSLHLQKEEKPRFIVKEYTPNAEDDDDFNMAVPKDNKLERTQLDLYHYGLSDYSTRDLSQESENQYLAEEVRCKIEAFVPRLKNIEVEVLIDDKQSARIGVKIKIEAALNVEESNAEDIKHQFKINI